MGISISSAGLQLLMGMETDVEVGSELSTDELKDP